MTDIQAVLFDWAGTTVDFGSRAPAAVFVEVFRRRGIEITLSEARGPMGRAKHEHIRIVASLPRVAEQWKRLYGTVPSDADAYTMYEEFLPLQKDVLLQGSDVIPGVVEAVRRLREHGIRIGSTTGYTRELMDVVIPVAAEQGYQPDVTVCSDEVPRGRPAPWMNLRAAEQLGIYPLDRILVVDDTPVGIEAGKNAGMKTAGVTLTGNSTGLSEVELSQLSSAEQEHRHQTIAEMFRAAGADMVVRSVAEIAAKILQ